MTKKEKFDVNKWAEEQLEKVRKMEKEGDFRVGEHIILEETSKDGAVSRLYANHAGQKTRQEEISPKGDDIVESLFNEEGKKVETITKIRMPDGSIRETHFAPNFRRTAILIRDESGHVVDYVDETMDKAWTKKIEDLEDMDVNVSPGIFNSQDMIDIEPKAKAKPKKKKKKK